MSAVTPIKRQYTFNKSTASFFAFLHVGALLALMPFAFSWSAVALFFFLHWLTASIGICLGFHRYLTHRSLTLPKWLANFIVLCGALACENGPIKWVAQHRMHHAGSDTEKDPHSAKKGFWWAHFNWMLYTTPEFDDQDQLDHLAADLVSDPFYQFLDKYFIQLQIVFGLALFAIGGLPWVVWGVFLRIVTVYHITWLVNSAAHYFGYKNFKLDGDLSTNCWWVGILAFGEGWHNNHHAYPRSARHGLRPWEIDMTWMAICLLRKLGLAKDIRVAQLEPKSEAFFEAKMVRRAA
ncbi:MAG: acyl-CoA desaturase [Nitrospinales bacterium]